LHTYKAIVRGNRLEWYDTLPAGRASGHPVAVHVIILDDMEQTTSNAQPGQQMAEVLEQLAQAHTFTEIDDPAIWEREIRRDRELPDRET